MPNWVNYHGHCHYCDGHGKPEEYITQAMRKKFVAYGFSSHSPVPFSSNWNMKASAVGDYLSEITHLKQQYAGLIEIYKSMEVDYIPNVTGPKHPDVLAYELDYTIGSVHYGGMLSNGKGWEIDGNHETFLQGVEEHYGGDVRLAVSGYFDLIKAMTIESCPDIIGHMDKIKIQNEGGKLFSEEEKWYQSEIEETILAIEKSGAIIEINTRGIYKKKSVDTYPSEWVLKKIFSRNIPITISSDAHAPGEIDEQFTETAEKLLNVGFKTLRVLTDNQWNDFPFSVNGIILSV